MIAKIRQADSVINRRLLVGAEIAAVELLTGEAIWGGRIVSLISIAAFPMC